MRPLGRLAEALGVVVSLRVPRKKSALERQLEESIRLAKKGKFRKPDSLANHLRKMDDEHLPSSLDDPTELWDEENQ